MAVNVATGLVQQQRESQVALSRAASSRIIHAYQSVWQDVNAQLAQIQRQIAAAQASGGEAAVNTSWLAREHRLEQLQRQVYSSVADFGDGTQRLIQQMTREAAQMGADDAYRVTQMLIQHQIEQGSMPWLSSDVISSFDRLDNAAIEDAANNAWRYYRRAKTTGNRIRTVASIFKEMPRDMAKRATRTIISAVAIGQHPEVTARLLQQQMGIGLNRALMVARTEQLNAYRRSSIDQYRANEDVLQGWQWLTGADPCPFCASMAKTMHSLDEDMDSHPNCRCAPSPVSKPLDDILKQYAT